MCLLVLFGKSTFNDFLMNMMDLVMIFSFQKVTVQGPINVIKNRAVPLSHSEVLGQQNGFESLHFLPSLIMDDFPLHETFQTDPLPFLDPSVIHCASLLPYPLICFFI